MTSSNRKQMFADHLKNQSLAVKPGKRITTGYPSLDEALKGEELTRKLLSTERLSPFGELPIPETLKERLEKTGPNTGFKPGELAVPIFPRFSATPPGGKTWLALRAAQEAGLAVVFPLEMDVTSARDFSKKSRKDTGDFIDEVHQAHTPMPEPVTPPPVAPPVPTEVDPPVDVELPKKPLQ